MMTKKQIVLTSDRLPNEIPKLQKRLVSRFRWGLSVDITPPDFETRTAILRKKAESDFLDVSDDALSYIAGKIDSNIRELEGALMRVSAYAKLKHQRITTSLAAEALRDLDQGSSSHELTISEIQNKVAKYYHVTVSELRGKKTRQDDCHPAPDCNVPVAGTDGCFFAKNRTGFRR